MKMYLAIILSLTSTFAFSHETALTKVTELLHNHCEATSCNQNLLVSFDNFICDFKNTKQCHLEFSIESNTESCRFHNYSNFNQVVEDQNTLTERFLEEAVDCINTKIDSHI